MKPVQLFKRKPLAREFEVLLSAPVFDRAARVSFANRADYVPENMRLAVHAALVAENANSTKRVVARRKHGNTHDQFRASVLRAHTSHDPDSLFRRARIRDRAINTPKPRPPIKTKVA
jgi:hypothetical protein